MERLPVIFGYAGIIPFILFFLLGLTPELREQAPFMTFVQVSYSAMILSFLGGIHWGQAIPRNDQRQMTFAMFPTIACLILMVTSFTMHVSLTLFALAGLFWVVFIADKKLMPLDYIPEGYFKFRKTLTMIVSASLFLSGLVYL